MSIPTLVTNNVQCNASYHSLDKVNLSSKSYHGDNNFELQDDSFQLFECDSDPTVVNVKGNLKRNLDFWLEINANDYILDVINNGYRLPFKDIPDSAHLKNNRSSLENDSFVKEAINDLLISGAATEVFSKPRVVNPLTVAQNSKKKRLVLDLRHVNQNLVIDKIKFEDLKVALLYAKQGDFMFSFDLKSGYHHIDIHKDFHTFLGFSWKFGNKIRYFQFTVLPFGLATAGHIFTKTVRCLVKHWRNSGMEIVVYLDDGLGFGHSFEQALINSRRVKSDLKNAGFVENTQKSEWDPVEELIWLGVMIDLQQGIIYITKKRIESVISLIKGILIRPRTTARKLAQITGKIISMSIVHGNITNLMLKYSHMSIINRVSWDSFFNVDQTVIEELTFWNNNLNKLNHRPIEHKLITERIVYSDASNVGCGGFIVDVHGSECFRSWEGDEKNMSSTYRELAGVYTVLKSMPHYLQGKKVKWYTDNQCVVSIINKGSMKRHLHELSLNIYKFACSNMIDLYMEWIPRDKNQIADQISRTIDRDDWQISIPFFKYMSFVWGPYTYDRFADNRNRKVAKFNSRLWTPDSSGVDAFAYSWEGENNWLVPPIFLISRCLRYLQTRSVNATLIVPYWPSAAFWPLIMRGDGKFKEYITSYKRFDNAQGFFVQGTVPSIFNQEFKGSVLALKFSAQA